MTSLSLVWGICVRERPLRRSQVLSFGSLLSHLVDIMPPLVTPGQGWVVGSWHLSKEERHSHHQLDPWRPYLRSVIFKGQVIKASSSCNGSRFGSSLEWSRIELKHLSFSTLDSWSRSLKRLNSMNHQGNELTYLLLEGLAMPRSLLLLVEEVSLYPCKWPISTSSMLLTVSLLRVLSGLFLRYVFVSALEDSLGRLLCSSLSLSCLE